MRFNQFPHDKASTYTLCRKVNAGSGQAASGALWQNPTLRSTVTISAAAAALQLRRTSNTKPSARLPDAGTRASRSAALLYVCGNRTRRVRQGLPHPGSGAWLPGEPKRVFGGAPGSLAWMGAAHMAGLQQPKSRERRA